MTDAVDRILEQWHQEKPGLDVSPMAVIGRLSRAAIGVEARLAATFTQHGLDSSSFDVLATLLRSGSPYRVTPAQLAREAMISTSAVAQRLNRLEARGLIERTVNPSDGRGTLVTLTDAGRVSIEHALPEHLETEWEILAPLSAAERTTLARLLAKITP